MVCNTSFANLSSTSGPICLDGQLRLGFASNDFLTSKWALMHVLDYVHLTFVLWGVCKRLQSRVEALERKKTKE